MNNTWIHHKYCLKLVIFLLIAFISISILDMSCSAEAGRENEEWPKVINIGAAPVGGTYYMAASAIAKVIGIRFPDIRVTVQVTGASKNNIQLIQADQIDIGLTSSNYGYEAWKGIGDFEGNIQDKVYTLMPAYFSNFIFVTLQKNPIYSFRDLKGKTVDIGVKMSAINKFGRLVLETFGMSQDVRITEMSSTNATRALSEGKIDALILGHPNPSVQELSMTNPVRIFSFNEEDMRLFLEKEPAYSSIIMPGGYYKGQEEDVKLPGLYLFYICHKNLPDDFVYTLVEAMYENKDTIASILPIVAESYNPETVVHLTFPLHPGSIKYFEEVGVTIPNELIPK